MQDRAVTFGDGRREVSAPADIHAALDQLTDIYPKPELIRFARRIQKTHSQFAGHLPSKLFHYSPWDMMLELFIAGEEGKPVCVKHLVITADEPASNAIRKIDRMEEADIIVRRQDPSDHRRIWVQLTRTGRQAVISVIRNLFDPNYPVWEQRQVPGPGESVRDMRRG